MKRIVVLIDGTWDEENIGADTNIARLDPSNKKIIAALIKPASSDGTEQKVFYHNGVGANGSAIDRVLGGAVGLGLKQIVLDGYKFVVSEYAQGDEIYFFGFSRGAYAVRALAGLIGASGILRGSDAKGLDVAWAYYRLNPATRGGAKGDDYRALAAQGAFHHDRSIKCVAVWDTVGSYGVPAGFGLAPLARYITLVSLGFHDTHLGDHVDVGLHAVGIDERRRPFVPTLWTIPKGQRPRGHVEQTWFAGVHCNVGGSYPDSGLSDLALIWMIARTQRLTSLQFDPGSVKAATKPNIDGEIVDSAKGWPVSQLFPHYRRVLSAVAIKHGWFFNTRNPKEEHINERVHWSVIAKRGRPCTVFGVAHTRYDPPNLPQDPPTERIAAATPEEQSLLTRP